ncbi:ATP-binding protein [Geopsychrobacter electrodiphilus]|uniref:ATP-binding protein n=1 Tax=Geopsychrobacter electrodiphilus TaxID=225196 RepID=UPI0003664CAF|nr:ATP-binding protein [Geopsychrobacter electrodiphilus]
MTPLKPGRKITLLAWVLVMIGLLAGVLSNGLVGWTLHNLNREGQQLAEQESRLSRGAEKLRHFTRQTQTALGDQLQLDLGPVHETFPETDLEQLRTELVATPEIDDLARLSNELGQRSYNLRRLWQQAVAWRENYQPIFLDNREKKSLLRVRSELQQLRAELEIYEGRQRLQEALTIRQWRKSGPAVAEKLAAELLSYRNQTWRRSLDRINTELVDLSRMVEILAGEDRLDQLADMKDNQLKPSLERMTHELARLRTAAQMGPDELPLRLLEALNVALFGEGYVIFEEYQTIRPGKGGLYLLSERRLELVQQREALQGEARTELQQLESLYPPLASLTQKRSRALARQADLSLSNGALNLFMISLLTLAGFLGLGLLIIRMTQQQLAALAQLRRQNELILASAGEGVMGVDRDGATIFINPAAANQLGWQDQELVGRHYQEILGQPDQGDLQADSIAQVLQQGNSYRSDIDFFHRRDGSQMPVACAVTPLQNELQEIEGAVVTFMDISDRKAAEKTLRRYYDRLAEQERALAELNKYLEQKVVERTLQLEAKSKQLIATQEELAHAEKLAAIGSLAAGVAHEINNPSAIIRGNIEILEAGLPANHMSREETSEILRQIERITLITGNLLSFARKQQLTIRSFPLNALLEEVLEQVGHQVSTRGIEIQTDLATQLPDCLADADRLRQVFNNLIVNGLQALNGRGFLRVSSRLEDGSFKVRIADNGLGILPENRGQIFHPFFTTKTDGTGLGLSVSYGIVEAHGGSISVESEPREGSCFTISLPQHEH